MKRTFLKRPSPEKPQTPDAKSQLRIWGFTGSPGVSRATRESQFVFVNRRPVENRGINYALIEGYHNSLMKGRYPVCCLFLEIDPAAVDVNIHPAKREVKFHREFEIRKFTAQAVRDALLAFHSGDPPESKRSDERHREPLPQQTPELPGSSATSPAPNCRTARFVRAIATAGDNLVAGSSRRTRAVENWLASAARARSTTGNRQPATGNSQSISGTGGADSAIRNPQSATIRCRRSPA